MRGLTKKPGDRYAERRRVPGGGRGGAAHARRRRHRRQLRAPRRDRLAAAGRRRRQRRGSPGRTTSPARSPARTIANAIDEDAVGGDDAARGSRRRAKGVGLSRRGAARPAIGSARRGGGVGIGPAVHRASRRADLRADARAAAGERGRQARARDRERGRGRHPRAAAHRCRARAPALAAVCRDPRRRDRGRRGDRAGHAARRGGHAEARSGDARPGRRTRRSSAAIRTRRSRSSRRKSGDREGSAGAARSSAHAHAASHESGPIDGRVRHGAHAAARAREQRDRSARTCARWPRTRSPTWSRRRSTCGSAARRIPRPRSCCSRRRSARTSTAGMPSRPVIERHQLTDEVDWLIAYSLDLDQEVTCETRQDAVAKLRALNDQRAVAPLRARPRAADQDGPAASRSAPCLIEDAQGRDRRTSRNYRRSDAARAARPSALDRGARDRGGSGGVAARRSAVGCALGHDASRLIVIVGEVGRGRAGRAGRRASTSRRPGRRRARRSRRDAARERTDRRPRDPPHAGRSRRATRARGRGAAAGGRAAARPARRRARARARTRGAPIWSVWVDREPVRVRVRAVAQPRAGSMSRSTCCPARVSSGSAPWSRRR